jgi:hypothetical protein
MDVKAEELSASQKSVIEELLGRKIDASETVSVRVFSEPPPSEEARGALVDWLARRDAESGRADEIPEEIFTEAMRSIRPRYRPVS